MAELKTLVVHHSAGDISPGAEIWQTEEIVAEEDMKIVACGFGWTRSLGHQFNATVLRSGQQREHGSYQVGKQLRTEDGFLFAVNAINPLADLNTESWALQILPDSDYFMLEKGERIYVHFHMKNSHASLTYSCAGEAILYYR